MTVGHVTLKGPNRLGAGELDEGALTARVVAQYAAEDGSGGQAAAERVLPARRALWRLAEVHLPQQLAASLRARLSRADQTGRDGVREMRRALADWLDPPPLCATCRRPITSETALVACPAKPQRTWVGKGRRPGPTTCAAARGPRALRAGAAQARSVARCGTLALFTPIHLDPACAAAARLLRHGATAYDLVVDRDARTLLEVTAGLTTCLAGRITLTPWPTPGGEESATENPWNAASHISHPSTTTSPVQAARYHFDRVLDAAVRANGPLILKCQLRQYSPNGSATRADLVQGAAMGCRRALLDYDPKVARFSTYAIHWMRQGGGEAFAERDLVAVPDWAAGLRRAVEDRDLAPAQLLRLVGAVAETRAPPAKVADAHQVLGDASSACASHAYRYSIHIEAVSELVTSANLQRAVINPARKASKGVAARPARTVVPEATMDAVVAGLLRAAAVPAKSKTDDDERARERVAAYVAARLGLRAGKKAVTGGALLTALRSGAAVVVGIGTGEHDDGGSDGADGPGAGRQERLPEHLADEAPDPEEAAAAEDEARREMAALLAALEALRVADPEAAEVVRRRHAMDGLGDPETLEEIAAAPLRCTGRSRCREGVRQAYERGKQVLKAAAPAMLAALPADVGHESAAVSVGLYTATVRPLPSNQPRTRHEAASDTAATTKRSYEFHDWQYTTPPTTAEDFGVWAAERDAMVAAF